MTPLKIDDLYVDGPKYLRDIDMLSQKYSIQATYPYSKSLMTWEIYKVILRESIWSGACSLIAALLVVLLITGYFQFAFIVLC